VALGVLDRPRRLIEPAREGLDLRRRTDDPQRRHPINRPGIHDHPTTRRRLFFGVFGVALLDSRHQQVEVFREHTRHDRQTPRGDGDVHEDHVCGREIHRAAHQGLEPFCGEFTRC
jgi:hypothetical protein